MDRNNDKAFEYAKKFLDNELLAMFKIAEQRKEYGNLVYSPNGETKADFIFVEGICSRCIEPLKGKNSIFYKSRKFI